MNAFSIRLLYPHSPFCGFSWELREKPVFPSDSSSCAVIDNARSSQETGDSPSQRLRLSCVTGGVCERSKQHSAVPSRVHGLWNRPVSETLVLLPRLSFDLSPVTKLRALASVPLPVKRWCQDSQGSWQDFKEEMSYLYYSSYFLQKV